jgi:hypothetical protein
MHGGNVVPSSDLRVIVIELNIEYNFALNPLPAG